MAMGDTKAAFADAQKAFLSVNSKAGYLTMRTDELDETEALRDEIQQMMDRAKP